MSFSLLLSIDTEVLAHARKQEKGAEAALVPENAFPLPRLHWSPRAAAEMCLRPPGYKIAAPAAIGNQVAAWQAANRAPPHLTPPPSTHTTML